MTESDEMPVYPEEVRLNYQELATGEFLLCFNLEGGGTRYVRADLPRPVDVEALKRADPPVSHEQDYVDGWNDCLDELVRTGRLPAKPPAVDAGVREALEDLDRWSALLYSADTEPGGFDGMAAGNLADKKMLEWFYKHEAVIRRVLEQAGGG